MKPLPRKHPLRNATWVWPECMLYLHNHYAQFRKDFELQSVPGRCPFFITADKAYKLYVNGTFVCRGPARGYQAHWPYDEINLAPHLRMGANTLAVIGYNPGISTFQYLHQNVAGLLCAFKDKTVAQAFDAVKWHMRRSPAHAPHTARLSMQLDFQEHVDLRIDDGSWVRGDTPVSGWSTRTQVLRGQNMTAFPASREPYPTLEERGIPLLREALVAPQRVTAHTTSAVDPAYRSWENVSWGWVNELRKITRWDVEPTPAMEHDGHEAGFTLEPTGTGSLRAVTLDMGRLIVGNLIVEIRGATGGEVIDFQHDQCLTTGRPEAIEPGEACHIALANRLTLRAGDNRHEFFHLLGFRHLTVIARECTSPLRVRLSVRTAGYPFNMRGRFECSDGVLNDIHAISRHTQQVCALDAYVDTPWREQAQWWGDARVQACNTFYLDGDDRLFARGINSIAGQTTANGLTFGHAPTIAYSCILPDFSLTWILTVYDHYFQTADPRLFKQHWLGIKRVLKYFDSPEARDQRTGLLAYDRRYWLFEDWSKLPKSHVPTFLNIWYLYTLQHLVTLLHVTGKTSDARTWQARLDQHTALVKKHLIEPGQGLIVGALDERGEPVGPRSVHDATLAILTGLCPERHPMWTAELLLPWVRDEKPDAALPSAFWATYVFEALDRMGYHDDVVRHIRQYWARMIPTGTTWEDWEYASDQGLSCSHAWSAHPSYHLVHSAAGLTQTAPGWTGVAFTPGRCREVDHAAATVPSPVGEIQVQWRRENGRLIGQAHVPEGVTMAVVFPDQSTQKWTAGDHRFDRPLDAAQTI
ncbi:MAG: Bacterial alpha-L-rhamnosidase [Phycisphaera sp.]|nr:Bacterial alpha-L-rhamnosidase [Phycisphaera sp.]